MKVRIVGIGTLNNETCVLSGQPATGYIEINMEMVPCNLKMLGFGPIGAFVKVPQELQSKLKELRGLNVQ